MLIATNWLMLELLSMIVAALIPLLIAALWDIEQRRHQWLERRRLRPHSRDRTP